MTHTIGVRISDELLRRLDEQVRARGGDRSDYIEEVLSRYLSGEPTAGMPLADILSAASGPGPAEEMTEEDLADFVEAEVKAHRAEKRRKALHG